MQRFVKVLSLVVGTSTFGSAFAANHDPAVIIPLLSTSKLSLVEGIRLAEAERGPATSAKFEVADDGKLVLSVYNIPEGFAVEPEKATLAEVSIDPTAEQPVLKFEVFEDKEHIARAAAHMTLFRLAPFTLVEVLERAARATGATPLDVRNPTVEGKRAVAAVVLYDRAGKPLTVTVDLLSGEVLKK